MFPVGKNYFIGLSADNNTKFYIDGELFINSQICMPDSTSAFNYWRVYEVYLDAGEHVIQMLGYNYYQVASMGAEIYDNTLTELVNATSVSQLNRLFTTEDFRTGTHYADVIQNSSGQYTNQGYTCPNGYTYACGQCYKFTNNCITKTPTNTPTKTLTPTRTQTPTNTSTRTQTPTVTVTSTRNSNTNCNCY